MRPKTGVERPQTRHGTAHNYSLYCCSFLLCSIGLPMHRVHSARIQNTQTSPGILQKSKFTVRQFDITYIIRCTTHRGVSGWCLCDDDDDGGAGGAGVAVVAPLGARKLKRAWNAHRGSRLNWYLPVNKSNGNNTMQESDHTRTNKQSDRHTH